MSVNVDENVQRQVREIFQHMEKTVTIKLFIDKEKCLTCHETKAILEMLKELAPKDKIEIIEFIKVFVTPTCPYCPVAVRVAHKIAMANPNVVGEMVEATEFSALSQKFNVMGVPKTVIDDGKVTFEGGVPEDMFISKVMEAFNKN